jgi:hypothetical protein
MLVSKTGAYHRVGRLCNLLSDRLCWKGLPGIHTSLSRTFVNYSCKKFYNVGPRATAASNREKEEATLEEKKEGKEKLKENKNKRTTTKIFSILYFN